MAEKKLVSYMKPFRYLSAVEQLAGHLRGEIVRGEFGGHLPGVGSLAAELGCSPRTVVGALSQPEGEGILEKQATGRRSRIHFKDRKNQGLSIWGSVNANRRQWTRILDPGSR
jgi:DNA-binding GntR family transcriptional regulator